MIKVEELKNTDEKSTTYLISAFADTKAEVQSASFSDYKGLPSDATAIEMGSDTRIFVKKVLEYANMIKKEKLYDDSLFSQLNEFNEKIINIFLNDINKNSKTLKENCIKYREILRKITEELL